MIRNSFRKPLRLTSGNHRICVTEKTRTSAGWLASRAEEAAADPPGGFLIVAVDESDATLWINDQFITRRRLELAE